MYKLSLLSAIVVTTQAQFVSNGPCNFSTPGHQVNLTSNNIVNDHFFEIKRINNAWNTGHCTSWYMAVRNGRWSISMTEVVKRRLITRNATVTPNQNSLKVDFPGFTSNFTFIGVGKEFVVLYACSNKRNKKQEYAWVLGLNKTLSESAKNTAEIIIRNNKLANATWVQSSHTEDSCRSGATNNIKLSSVLVLIIGFVAAKEL